jgi:RHS repeat-associated protein
MMAANRSGLKAAIRALILLAGTLTGFADPVFAAADTADAHALATIKSAHFAEPLIAVKQTGPAEDAALANALATFARRKSSTDYSALAAFAGTYPSSGWTPALFTNLGILYLHDGSFSRALDAWQRAWRGGKDATEPHARALVDRAVGELARLEASLGQDDELAKLFDEIGNRPVTGSATEAIQNAAEQLARAKKNEPEMFLCGPRALASLLLARGANFQQIAFLEFYKPGANGTNLAEVGGLADKAQFAHRLIFRKPGQPVPVPSIIHWKVGHFAAIVGEANGRYEIDDPVFPGQKLWITPAALDAEASGYYLASSDIKQGPGWRDVQEAEAAKVWGKGQTFNTAAGGAGARDPKANSCPPSGGMCAYNIGESTVSVALTDTPVGYAPPIGPSAKVTISYNQREDSQPAVFNFFNISPKWTLNFLSYVTDDPTNPGATVTRYLPGGGAYYYSGYNASTKTFAAQNNDGSILVLASQTPVTYQRQLADGSIEIYAQADGATSYPRNIFLSQIIDPQGNALTLNYDSQMRLVSLTDATGRQTTFTYGVSGAPLLMTQITDPFGRSATLTYDGSGRLSSITDVLDLTSSFAYDSNSLVDAMTTPYGTTSFAYTAPGTGAPPRFVQVTDPLNYNEREEWLEPAPIPDSEPSAPQGMATTNEYLTYRDSFHWDKNAYGLAGCTPTGGCDYTKARDRHFNHEPSTGNKSTSIESVKYALENRIWYNYPAQSTPIYAGTYEQPTATGRVLDDGSTQHSQASYDTGGYFKPTQTIDPLGRITSFAYANHVDLSAISQTTALGVATTIAQFIYNTKHRPIFYTDAAGETTSYTYNAAGQLTSVTNPLGQTTQYQYDTANNLTTIINANNVTAASLTYDAFDRVATYTDSEGWSMAYSYDAADRVTKVTYPDGTSDNYTYNKLDLASYQDRQNRLWTYAHDANRHLTSITDPLGSLTQFGYNNAGELTTLTDPKSNVTTWNYDVQGRLTSKQYADASNVTYTYENTTSRLKSVLDALGQTKQLAYAEDNRLAGLTYLSAVNPTPNVSFAYDPYFPRLVSMTDGNGTTQYNYVPVGSLGALQLQQEASPLAASAIAYAYDALGRLTSRTVGSAGAETFQYDTLGRLDAHAGDLGSFSFSYLGQTSQITARQLLPVTSNLETTWSYLPNSGDRRLASIGNVGLSTGQYSNYGFTTTPENLITAITESSDASTAYPTASTQSATYNNLNQLTNLSGQALTFDANGNLTSDGLRNYTWDAENRLVGITYPGSSGKATTFSYDGLNRRTAIASTPTGGGSTVTTPYVWCGARICQARNASNAITREYFAEGEFLPGSPSQTYYYGPDQIGSVRRVFASTSSAPAYSYDPYGNALQATAPIADFNYAGMFYNADSGLYLTQYRAYDAVSGRWISRDPLGEASDPAADLYRYASGNPISLNDPSGRQSPLGAVLGAVILGGLDLAKQLAQNGGNISCVNPGEVGAAALLGALLGGAPELAAAAEAADFSAIGSTGEIGEAVLEQLGGESQVYFNTSLGGRYVDQLVDGWANESKVGYQSLTSANEVQILKDAELVNSGRIEGSTWHFFTSPVTGLGGPSAPLSSFLQQNGIGIVVY